MEKLQPLLKHKFWIIGGVVLLVTLVGWWLGTSAKAAYIQQRWDTLSALQVAQGSNTPNQDYIDEIGKVIQVLDKRQDVLDNRLYESQKSLHTWPKNVAKYMDGSQFRDPAKYDALNIYAREHYDEYMAMVKSLPLYSWDDMGNEYGIVFVADVTKPEIIPHVPPSVWKAVPPTSDAMWNTQEDIWLTRSILEAIKQVNRDAGATKISDAAIKSILSLKFRGGSRDEAGNLGGGVGGGGGGEGTMMSAGDYMSSAGQNYSGGGEDMGMPGGYGGSSGGGGDFPLNKSLKPDLDAAFGPETVQLETTDSGTPEGMSSMMSSGGGAGPKKRYVDDDPALPYRTRGFYIEVMMLHDKLPDLQASLVSMPWPTELLLIQQASEQEDIIRPVVEQTKQGGPPRSRFNQTQPGGFRPGATTFSPRGFGPGASRGGMGRGGTGGQQFGPPRFQPGASRGGAFGPMNPMGPMGNYGPMGPMGDMGNYEGQPFNGGSQYQEDSSAFAKAMGDPYLAKVGIAGLMTIYKSPQEMAKSKGQEALPVIQTEIPVTTEGQPTEGQPAEGQPTDQGTQPLDPNAKAPVEPGTEPMPGEPMTQPTPAPETPQAAPNATNPNPTEPMPTEQGNAPVPPATDASTPEPKAPMNSEAPKPGEAIPQEAPPPENPNS